MRTFAAPAELITAAPEPLGVSGWHVVDQPQIDAFARLTGDDQWIHTDVERARSGPFGATVAHGYLLLGLLTPMLAEVFAVPGSALAVNGGLEQVRFITPVPAGSRIRARADLTDAVAVPGGFVRTVIDVSVEAEGRKRPALTARTTSLYRSALYRSVLPVPGDSALVRAGEQ